MLLPTTDTIEKITSYVSQMTEPDQKLILEALERRDMMAKAARLNASINKNIKITTSDIVAEIKKIRIENAGKRSGL